MRTTDADWRGVRGVSPELRARWADYYAMLRWLYGDVEQRMRSQAGDLKAWMWLGRERPGGGR
jgi:hypothetical protein